MLSILQLISFIPTVAVVSAAPVTPESSLAARESVAVCANITIYTNRSLIVI